jgi:hypothetical protein
MLREVEQWSIMFARRNLSVRSKTYNGVIAEGAFRYVAKGVYTEGRRNGQPSVTKWFKEGAVYEADFYAKDIKAVEQAQKIIDAFNDEGIVDELIVLNHPEVWEVVGFGQKVLVEPYIANFQKFNSNTGAVFASSGWDQLMQALSHFSYHKTGGQMVLCDLQGGIVNTRRFQGAVLTDPVILSRTRSYGVTDLGTDGISTFFARHTCNRYCQNHWTKPRDAGVYYPACAGTRMQMAGQRQDHGMYHHHINWNRRVDDDDDDDWYDDD